MTTGVALLNFGEPAEPTRERVVDYLERIFMNNASLEGDTTREEARRRSRQLAERRAPALIEEYEEIGGSPMHRQSRAQADALESALRARGYDVRGYVGRQFTEPFMADAVDSMRADGVDRVVAIPDYPLCGPSTTVAALEALADAVADADWDVEVAEVTGWHRHPTYNRLRVDAIRDVADEHDLDLADEDTALVFSAHGTPQHYLDQGSRYEEYVEEFCAVVAAELGVESYELGYQNHTNRDIEWTEPDVEDVVEGLDAERVVVDPVSFMHEQSETLSELDVELREEAEAVGLEFYRVPVPHDDERFGGVLADVVEPFVAGFDPGYYNMRPCECRDREGTMCLNSTRRP